MNDEHSERGKPEYINEANGWKRTGNRAWSRNGVVYDPDEEYVVKLYDPEEIARETRRAYAEVFVQGLEENPDLVRRLLAVLGLKDETE